MKLFSSTQISWSEPWLFVIRLRNGWGWQRRLLLALAVALVMFLSLHFLAAQPWGLPRAMGVSLMCGFTILLLLDVPYIQREVTIFDDRINISSAVGTHWVTSFRFPQIQFVQLLTAEEWDKPWNAMMIHATNDIFITGVPRKVSLTTIASILYRLKIDVRLEGWAPPVGDSRIQVRDEILRDPQLVRGVTAIRDVEPGEPGLTPTSVLIVQLIMALGPLALSLVGCIAAGIYLYQNRAPLSVVNRSLIGGGAFAALVVSFFYLIVAGQFLAARYGVSAARSVLRSRVSPLVSGLDDDLYPVEVFDRHAWTSVVAKSVDFGFLQIDPGQRQLRFEGNKQRWEIPASAIRSCRIAESHVGKEGNQHAEKRYFVVLESAGDGGSREAGMIYTRTEIGNDTAEARYNRARLLFTQLADFIAR